jgi:hypothetical protein
MHLVKSKALYNNVKLQHCINVRLYINVKGFSRADCMYIHTTEDSLLSSMNVHTISPNTDFTLNSMECTVFGLNVCRLILLRSPQ